MKRRLKKSVIRIIGSVLLYAGYMLIATPFIVDQYSRIGQTATINAYNESVSNLTQQQIADQLEQCITYNENLTEKYKNELYHYSSKTDYDDQYLKLPVEENKQICTLIIPKINVNLPVGHGTSDELLQTMAGHLYGTSLPVGGNSTHAVIAAHSGLRTSELFSRLDELEIGDEINVRILGEQHTYKVNQIKIVLPDECDQYLQIVPDKDLITLYTCTPYGINTHRLLVQAERTDDLIIDHTKSLMSIKNEEAKPLLIIAGITVLPVIILIITNMYIMKGEKISEKMDIIYDNNNCFI